MNGADAVLAREGRSGVAQDPSVGRKRRACRSSSAAERVVRHPVRNFLLRLSVGYGLLLLLWWVVGPAYRAGLVTAGTWSFAPLGAAYHVEFREFRDWRSIGMDSVADVAVVVHRPQWVDAHGRAQHVLAKRIVTFTQPYSATAFLLALFAATQLPWRSRLGCLLVAFIALHAAMFLCVGIDVAQAFATQGTWPAMPRAATEVLAVLSVTITDWPIGVFIVPLVLWALACFGLGAKPSPCTATADPVARP